MKRYVNRMKSNTTYLFPATLLPSFVFMALFCIGRLNLPAQVLIDSGSTLSKVSGGARWYYVPKTRKLYRRGRNDWMLIARQVVSISRCGENLVYREEETHCSHLICELSENAWTNYSSDKSYFCGDSMIGFWIYNTVTFISFKNDTISFMESTGQNPCIPFKPHTVQGQQAFCVSRYDTQRRRITCHELHEWGMLGSNGQWLIEPKFDQPFRFQNGFAEVIYYSKRRKINEKGEFVE